MLRRLALSLVMLAACSPAPTQQAQAPTAAPVVAAERAFAADAATRGWVLAFRAYAAADAQTLNLDPVNAQENLAQQEAPGGTDLDWRPAYAGIARSGDFGFTTGPFQIRGREGVIGHYFTVWRLQADGAWKWIFDAGTDVVDAAPVAMDLQVPELPVAAEGAGSAVAAINQVTTLESENATPAVLAALLADDAHVNRPFVERAQDRAAAQALFNADGAVTYRALRQEASSAGDMVFTLGEVRDHHEGAERLRYYARMWQLRPEGWRIVFDEIVPRRA